jgi:hypothetical protein
VDLVGFFAFGVFLAALDEALKKVTVLGGPGPRRTPGLVGAAHYEHTEFRRSVVFEPLAACAMRADWLATGWKGGVACAFGFLGEACSGPRRSSSCHRCSMP